MNQYCVARQKKFKEKTVSPICSHQDANRKINHQTKGIKSRCSSGSLPRQRKNPYTSSRGRSALSCMKAESNQTRKLPHIVTWAQEVKEKNSICVNTYLLDICKSAIAAICHPRQLGEKYFDYFVFNIVDYGVNYGLLRSGVCRRALPQTIGNARGLDINSPLSMKAHTQDLWFSQHQQHGDPNSARGLWCMVNDQPVGNPKRKVWWV
jgi:hypothetical protein